MSLLRKARCIHDASLPSARRPPALQQRAATAQLPTVIIGVHVEAGGKRERHESLETAAAVAAFVVQVRG